MNPENHTIRDNHGPDPAPENIEPCRHCDPLLMSQGGGETGCQPMPVMTDREIAVLGSMRGVKKEVYEIKRRLRLAEEDLPSEEVASLNQRLIVLKEQWQEMDHERMEAAEERMRLLGHSQ